MKRVERREKGMVALTSSQASDFPPLDLLFEAEVWCFDCASKCQSANARVKSKKEGT